MKICPRCGYQCGDAEKYCVRCRTNVAKVAPAKEGKLFKKVNTGVGCLVIVIAAIIVLLIVTLLPGALLNPSSQNDFGSGITPYFGREARSSAESGVSAPLLPERPARDVR